MKLKEQGKEKEGMNKELYDLFIKMIQFEYNKISFLKGAKFYCWARGMENHCKFFKSMFKECNECLNSLIYYLLCNFEEVPEFVVPHINTEYKSVEEVFTTFAENEDEFVKLLEELTEKAKNTDIKALAFLLPILKKVDHIACRALEAVKNDQNPYDLIADCENNISC